MVLSPHDLMVQNMVYKHPCCDIYKYLAYAIQIDHEALMTMHDDTI